MNAKDKAIELVDKFLNLKPKKMSDYSKIYLPTAKECALICAKEQLNLIEGIGLEGDGLHIYWQEVKKQIEKL